MIKGQTIKKSSADITNKCCRWRLQNYLKFFAYYFSTFFKISRYVLFCGDDVRKWRQSDHFNRQDRKRAPAFGIRRNERNGRIIQRQIGKPGKRSRRTYSIKSNRIAICETSHILCLWIVHAHSSPSEIKEHIESLGHSNHVVELQRSPEDPK